MLQETLEPARPDAVEAVSRRCLLQARPSRGRRALLHVSKKHPVPLAGLARSGDGPLELRVKSRASLGGGDPVVE